MCTVYNGDTLSLDGEQCTLYGVPAYDPAWNSSPSIGLHRVAACCVAARV
jgi:hypothetical protein